MPRVTVTDSGQTYEHPALHPKNRRETPQDLFEAINQVWPCTLDICAEEHNAKVESYVDLELNGLELRWRPEPGTFIWCNPPYSGGLLDAWIHRAMLAAERGVGTVLLLPARTGAQWFRDLLVGPSRMPIELIFVRGRVQFIPSPDQVNEDKSTNFENSLIAVTYPVGARHRAVSVGSLVVFKGAEVPSYLIYRDLRGKL